MTHAVPIVGLESESFSDVDSTYFSSGGYLLNALITGNIDIAYIGPGPYINALSKGIKLNLLSISSSGANSFVVSEDYDPSEEFVVHKIGVPQLGNTQDLLAKILVDKIQQRNSELAAMNSAMKSFAEGGGITISNKAEFIPVHPAELELAFYTGAIDSALVTEPWGTILENKGLQNLNSLFDEGPINFVDELEGLVDSKLRKELQSINEFPAALLVVEHKFYRANKDLVDRFIDEQNQVFDYVQENQAESLLLVQEHFKKIMKRDLDLSFLLASFEKVRFDTKLDINHLQELIDASAQAKYMRKKLDLSKVVI